MDQPFLFASYIYAGLPLCQRHASSGSVRLKFISGFGSPLLSVGEPNLVPGLGFLSLGNCHRILLLGNRLLQLLLHHDVVVPRTGTSQQLSRRHNATAARGNPRCSASRTPSRSSTGSSPSALAERDGRQEGKTRGQNQNRYARFHAILLFSPLGSGLFVDVPDQPGECRLLLC
jgi:hypothetical protein